MIFQCQWTFNWLLYCRVQLNKLANELPSSSNPQQKRPGLIQAPEATVCPLTTWFNITASVYVFFYSSSMQSCGHHGGTYCFRVHKATEKRVYMFDLSLLAELDLRLSLERLRFCKEVFGYENKWPLRVDLINLSSLVYSCELFCKPKQMITETGNAAASCHCQTWTGAFPRPFSRPLERLYCTRLPMGERRRKLEDLTTPRF